MKAHKTECINPHLPGGPVHPYQLASPFPILGVYAVLFHFYSITVDTPVSKR